MTPRRPVVVVGASLAGLSAVEALREAGWDGPVIVVGAEARMPYDRPPLSKQVLAGTVDPGATALRTPEALAALEAEWILGRRAAALETAGPTVVLDDGRRIDASGVVVATGAEPRRLPRTGDLTGVHVLRTLDDALALRADLGAGPARVVVVGAGFIGAEVAATARGRGHEVTVVEAAGAPFATVLGTEVGELVARLHADAGTRVRTGVGVARLLGRGRVEAVELADGTRIDADVVVVGIGVRPATGWLAGSGLRLDDGVVCDETCSAAPGVVAAGDVCRWPHRLYGRLLRVEHWDNAVEQGRHAARRLLDPATGPYAPVPFFWSDQYDRKLQMVGLPGPEVRILGDPDERRFVALYGEGGVLVGAFGMNRPRQVMRARALIDGRTSLEDATGLLAG